MYSIFLALGCVGEKNTQIPVLNGFVMLRQFKGITHWFIPPFHFITTRPGLLSRPHY